MNKDENISEEQLNAFIDGELESEEISGVFDEAEQSAELDQRLCRQRKLKELVKHAYRDVPEPRRRSPVGRMPASTLGLALVASLLLFVGAAAGIFLNHSFYQNSLPAGYETATASQPVIAAENYILHVSSGDPEQMQRALKMAKSLLSSAQAGAPRQVEVVANEKGLDLLRSDITRFADEINYLASNKVVFYACSKTIQRLEERGVAVRLVPEANSGYTALDRVVLRMQDGWEYIEI